MQNENHERDVETRFNFETECKMKIPFSSIFNFGFCRKSLPSGLQEERVNVRTVAIHTPMLGSQSIASNVPLRLGAHMSPNLKSRNYMYNLRSV